MLKRPEQLYIFIFIEGFLSISFEILAIRIFTPFFGAGLEQTSLIIGTTLLFFGIGNYFSNEDIDPDKNIKKLKRNILILAP